MHVLDGAGQAEAARRRVPVGRVADEEDPAFAVALRHHGLDRPARDLVDLQRQVGDAERGARVRLDLLVRLGSRVVHRVVQVDDPLLRMAAPALGAHRDHHDADAGLRGEQPADQDVVVAGQLGEVGADVQRRRLGHDAQADVRDADERGDGAPAVGADDVAAADGVLGVRLAVADRRGDAPRRPAPARSARGRTGRGPGRARSAWSLRIGSRRICGRFSWRRALAARQFSSSPPAPQHSILAISRPWSAVGPVRPA